VSKMGVQNGCKKFKKKVFLKKVLKKFEKKFKKKFEKYLLKITNCPQAQSNSSNVKQMSV
jgi:hypothetical protein